MFPAFTSKPLESLAQAILDAPETAAFNLLVTHDKHGKPNARKFTSYNKKHYTKLKGVLGLEDLSAAHVWKGKLGEFRQFAVALANGTRCALCVPLPWDVSETFKSP